MEKIESDLLRSKQNVVKHVIQSRSLEKAKVQAQLIEQALQLRIETSMGLHSGRYAKYMKMINSEKCRFDLDDVAVYTIEIASNASPPGVGRVIYNVHVSFNDKNFLEKLESLVVSPSMVTADFFFKVANASSNGAITKHDALHLYNRASGLALGMAPPYQANEQGSAEEKNDQLESVRWKLLKGLLRRKLVHIKLTMSVLQSPEYQAGQGYIPNNSNDLNNTHNTLSVRMPVGMLASRASTAEASLSLLSSGLHNSKSESQLISPGKLRKSDLLSTSLEKSLAKQSDLKNKISSSIISLYGTEGVSVEALRKNKSALKAFRKIAAEKLFGALEKMYLHFIASMLLKWQKSVEVTRVEQMCQKFEKNLSAYRMLQVMELRCVKQIHRAMQRYKEFVRRAQEAEYHGAVQQLQRVWRGCLGRHHVKIAQRVLAATRVQVRMRMFLARKTVQERQRQKRLRRYVAVIENKWRSHVWIRTMKKVFHLQKTIRNAKIIQRVYRGYKGRKRFAMLDLMRKKYRNAVKFQSVWRRYRAIVRVDLMLQDQKYRKSVVVIQKTFRAFHVRVGYVALRDIHRKAKVIQYLGLRRRAYLEMMRRKKIRCAIKIQRVVRGRQGRQRVKMLRQDQLSAYEAYWRAVRTVEPIILGYATRKRWAPRVAAHVARRAGAAGVLQKRFVALLLGQKARARVRVLQQENDLQNRKNKLVVRIQKRIRGVLGRIKAREQRRKVLAYRELQSRQPYYYRLKDEYYRSQNMYHRAKVVKIQCLVRCHLARRRVYHQRRHLAVLRIQKFLLGKQVIQEARLKLAKMKRELAKRFALITMANLRIAMFLRRKRVERLAKKRLQVKIIKWFLSELVLINKLKQAKFNFRNMKSVKIIENKAVTKIQAVIRGKQAKDYVEKSRRRLVRQRNARRVEKRQKMALKIQCRVRQRQAAHKAQTRRQLKADEERERREFEELELSLEGLHEDFMTELLVIRAQKGVRSMLAKAEFIKKVEQYKAQREKELLDIKRHAARRMQALIRGVLGRMKFKKNLPALKRAQKVRGICCECESNVAVRRCRQCKDKYCASCYDRIHAKGTRRQHGWEHIKQDVRAISTAKGSRGRMNVGGADEFNSNAVAVRAPRKQDWEEFYDESARAKYWFNKLTGEASWTQPQY